MRWPTTVEEALLLPKQYGIVEERLRFLLTFVGDDPSDQARAVQAYVAHRRNGFYVPAVFNLYLWRAVGSVLLLSLAVRYLVPPIHRLPRPLRRLHTSVETILTLRPLWGTSSSEPKRFLDSSHPLSAWTSVQIPLFVDGVLLSLYLALNFYFTFFHYSFLENNIFFPDPEGSFPSNQYFRALADRTAILSFGSTPLVILLAARNSPISWLTGASFARLQVWHRWVSRVTFGAVWIHASVYGRMIMDGEGTRADLFKKVYLRWGWFGIIGGCVLCVASWRRLRELSYEVFLVGHILGALAWVIGAYFHVAYLRTQREHLYWIYVTTAFWAGDRVLRLLSLLINNTPLRLLSILNVFAKHFPSASPALHNLEPSSSSAEAEASIVGDGEFVRLRIRPARKWPTSRGRPGTYVFISIPGDKRVWESHPFSIAWPLDVPLAYTSSSPSSSLASSSSSSVRLEDEDVDVAPPEMIELVVKRCEGFTKRLARAAGQGDAEGVGGGARSVKILVEGPYGTVHTFEKEKWVLLVAGGSGIAATVSHLADMAKQAFRSTLRTERVVVVWSIRTVETVSILLPYLQRLRPLLHRPSAEPFLDIHIYLTRSEASAVLPKPISTPASILSPVLDAEDDYTPFITLTTHLGRPQLGQHIDDLLNVGSREMGRVAVSACGPLGLCDRAREAVRERLGGDGVGGDRLFYKEEGGTW